MIMGNCPYPGCDGPLLVPIGDGAGSLLCHECRVCARPIWTYLSRVDPWSMTDEDFRREYVVNEETKQITLSRDDATRLRSMSRHDADVQFLVELADRIDSLFPMGGTT